MVISLLFPAFLSFFVVFSLTPWWIRYLKKIHLEVKDQNKENTPLVAFSGGIPALVGMLSGLFLFIFIRTFFPRITFGITLDSQNLLFLFASMISLFIITFVGFLDDLVLENKESSSGLKQWQKPLLTLTAAIPLMVVSVGNTDMGLPFIGVINFGILYPLVFVPLGLVGAANMVNMLAGFNGLETGVGIVTLTSLGLFAYKNGGALAALIALVTVFALLAFYLFNKTPAKILAGDSLTYLVGGTLAVIAIVGNVERAALILSTPFFLEFLLKARSKFKAQTYGYWKDGKIHSRHNREIYSLPHLFTRTGKFTEKQITFFMILISLFFSILIWIV